MNNIKKFEIDGVTVNLTADPDLIDDSESQKKLCYIDANGNFYVGGVKYIEFIDRASYDALVTKENHIYMVYPTPGGGA